MGVKKTNPLIELYRANIADPETLQLVRWWTAQELKKIETAFASVEEMLSILTDAIAILDDGGSPTDPTEPPTGSGHTIRDEGVPKPDRANLNFVGAGVNVVDNPGSSSTDVHIAGGGGGGGSAHIILDEGVTLPDRGKLNFIGAGVNAVDNPGADATDVFIDGGALVGNVDGGDPDDEYLAIQNIDGGNPDSIGAMTIDGGTP